MPNIESSLFDFDGWDGDHSSMIYYDCILTRNIGKYKKGDSFNSISINNDEGILEIYEGDAILDTFKLKYDIVEETNS